MTDDTTTESKRICFMCDRELHINKEGTQTGYYCCDEYFCNDHCLRKSFQFTDETWQTHYSDDGDCYWTEWEV